MAAAERADCEASRMCSAGKAVRCLSRLSWRFWSGPSSRGKPVSGSHSSIIALVDKIGVGKKQERAADDRATENAIMGQP